MSTVDKIMALADEYMRVGDEDGMREALRAAIVEALGTQQPAVGQAHKAQPVAWRFKFSKDEPYEYRETEPEECFSPEPLYL